MQLQLARIALTVAQALGANPTAELSDFLFDPEPEFEGDHLAAAIEHFEFKPRNVKA